MTRPTHIIYIPGLGDYYDGFRRLSLRCWRLWGVTTEHVPITWYDGGDLESKIMLVQDAVTKAKREDVKIVLIGESAGASLALHMAARDAGVEKVITLCGVTRRSTPISQHLRKRAPALHAAVQTIPDKLQIPIDSVRAVVDGTVGKRYSVAVGAKAHVIWSVGHLTTIALCLTLLAPLMASIAKKP